MNLIELRSEQIFVRTFRTQIETFWNLEDKAGKDFRPHGLLNPNELQKLLHSRMEQQYPDEYSAARSGIAKGVDHAQLLSARLGIMNAYETSGLGRPKVNTGYFYSILNDSGSIRVPRAFIKDCLDAMEADLERKRKKALFAALNPINWMSFVVRTAFSVPYSLLHAAGFDLPWLKTNVFGKLLNAALVIAVCYALIHWLGFKPEQVASIINSIFGGK